MSYSLKTLFISAAERMRRIRGRRNSGLYLQGQTEVCVPIVRGFAECFSSAKAVLAAGVVCLCGSGCGRDPDFQSPASNEASRKIREVAAEAARIEARERKADETVWAKEILAQECGRVIEAFWDDLNAATNKLHRAKEASLGEVTLGRWDERRQVPHGIEVRTWSGPGESLSSERWQQWIGALEQDGWALETVEFRHNQFDVTDSGGPKSSVFYFCAHLLNERRQERAVAVGDLMVEWAAQIAGGPAVVRRVDASPIRVLLRKGEAPFQLALRRELEASPNASWVDPLIVYDTDGDGIPEIVLLARNRLYRRQPDSTYRELPLFNQPTGLLFTGVVGDFDGDGQADLLCATARGLLLYRGAPDGTWAEPGEVVWTAALGLANPMVLTCGDVDRDGDLDVFLGQYRVPSLGQIFKPSYHAANDGHPAYLLQNDGHGRFTDATAQAGLEKKRHRRVFSASLTDLDGDQNLDLIVISDFAGIDVYRNGGQGVFTDVTRDWLPEAHGFGMSHTVGDFNGDGRPDLLMLGMNSPAASRMNHLGLVRAEAIDNLEIRREMTHGNRLFLARAEGGFATNSLGESLARSGWSWGCSAFDADNDGYLDVYITNGNETKQSVRDYESEFWLHDLYIDESFSDAAATSYFLNKYQRTRGSGWSYGGHEKNRLYLNQRGAPFLEAAYLFGVGLEDDSSDVVSADIDADGRMDLVLLSNEASKGKQVLRIYRNQLADGGNWIGFQFRDQPGQPAGGTVVKVRRGTRTWIRQITTGDSFRSQHPSTIHFGLGAEAEVDAVEIRWTNGKTVHRAHPAINRYHAVAELMKPVASAE